MSCPEDPYWWNPENVCLVSGCLQRRTHTGTVRCQACTRNYSGPTCEHHSTYPKHCTPCWADRQYEKTYCPNCKKRHK